MHRPPERSSADGPLSLLTEGAIEVKGRLPWSSNYTFLVELCLDGQIGQAVYKPVRGERPLWDYPPGLFKREIGAYIVSEHLGFGLVPETVAREGPLGMGSLQRFVPADFSEHYFTLLERPQHHEALKTICLFDMVINNGDRKSGHCLLAEDGRIWAVDHGLCLHVDRKLRTVIWDFGGQPIPDDQLERVARLASDPPSELTQFVSDAEIEALAVRAAAIVRRRSFPKPGLARDYPWPLV